MFPTHLVRQKPGVLRPGFVGMRGQWSYDYGMQDYEYPPPPMGLKQNLFTNNDILEP